MSPISVAYVLLLALYAQGTPVAPTEEEKGHTHTDLTPLMDPFMKTVDTALTDGTEYLDSIDAMVIIVDLSPDLELMAETAQYNIRLLEMALEELISNIRSGGKVAKEVVDCASKHNKKVDKVKENAQKTIKSIIGDQSKAAKNLVEAGRSIENKLAELRRIQNKVILSASLGDRANIMTEIVKSRPAVDRIIHDIQKIFINAVNSYYASYTKSSNDMTKMVRNVQDNSDVLVKAISQCLEPHKFPEWGKPSKIADKLKLGKPQVTKPQDSSFIKFIENLSDSTSERPPVHTSEKPIDITSAKPLDSTSEKPPVRTSKKPLEKTSEKPLLKTSPKSLDDTEKPAETLFDAIY